MATLNLFYIILALIINITNSQTNDTNQWEKDTGPNGEDIWRSLTDFIPVQSQSFGTIRIGREMSAEFDFIWGGRTFDPTNSNTIYEMFFRIGFDASIASGCDGEGARYPSFWVTSVNTGDKMHVSASSGSSCQPSQTLNGYHLLYGGLVIGESYHLKITFNDTLLVVTVTGGGNEDWTQTWDRNPTRTESLGKEAKVWWMSNRQTGIGFFNRGNGTFSNVVFTSNIFVTDSPTSSPTEPTSEPTRYPSGDPTSNPTADPTEDPTADPTRNPTTAQPSTNPSRQPTASPVREGGIGNTGSPTMDPTSAPEEEEETDKIEIRVKYSQGTMTGIAIGCAAVLLCICLGICILCRKKKRKIKRMKSKETPGITEAELQARFAQQNNAVNMHNNHQQHQPYNAMMIQSSFASSSQQSPPQNYPYPAPARPPPTRSSLRSSQGALQIGVMVPNQNMNDHGQYGEDDLPYSPLTNEGNDKGLYLSQAQQAEFHRTAGDIDDDALDDEIDDLRNEDPMKRYLSNAQKEELHRTPYGQGNSNELDVPLGPDEHIIAASDDDDDEVIGQMETDGYIGSGADVTMPKLPPSKPQPVATMSSIDHADDPDLMAHVQTMGVVDEEDMIDDIRNFNDDQNINEDIYDPASPDAMRNKLTIGAEMDDEDDDDMVDDIDHNDYYPDQNHLNINMPKKDDSDPDDDIYAPAHSTTSQ